MVFLKALKTLIFLTLPKFTKVRFCVNCISKQRKQCEFLRHSSQWPNDLKSPTISRIQEIFSVWLGPPSITHTHHRRFFVSKNPRHKQEESSSFVVPMEMDTKNSILCFSKMQEVRWIFFVFYQQCIHFALFKSIIPICTLDTY